MLEIGTGSGYSTAVLAQLADGVLSFERPGLAERARATLGELGVEGVEVVLADGSRGHREAAPYDAIAVHAATPEAPHSLIAQLAPEWSAGGPDRGWLVRPADRLPPRGDGESSSLRQETIGPCRFVPLIGAEGFSPR